MRLIECYVEGFGKISRQKFCFADGLNCMTEDNGSGKSTLAAFIKVMLYGMSDTKKQSLDENDRKHYLPWNGAPCGGSLTFSAKGKTYRVERSFAPKAADDSYTLYDTATGRVCQDFPEGLGEGLFGIDADGFERTVFLSERSLTPKSENKSISAKLSDLVGCDGDIGGMDEAMKVLEERRKFYHKKGGSGELSEVKAQIDEIRRRLISLDALETEVERAHKRMGELNSQIAEKRAEAKLILKDREAAMIRAAETNHEKRYNEMKALLEESIKRRHATAEVFGADIPGFNEINDYALKQAEALSLMKQACDSPETAEFKALSAKYDGRVERSRIEEARAALESLKSERAKENDPRLLKAKKIFSGRVPDDEEISAIYDTVRNGKAKQSPLFPICMVAGLILAVAGYFIHTAVMVAGIVITFAMAIAGSVSSARASKTRVRAIEDFFISVSGVRVSEDEEALARLADMRELLPVIRGDGDRAATEEYMAVIKSLCDCFSEESGDPVRRAEEIIKGYDRYAYLAVAERYIAGDRASRTEKAERLLGEVDCFLKRFKTVSNDPFGELRRALTEYDRLTAEIKARREEMNTLESLNKMGEGSKRQAAIEIDMLNKRREENELKVGELGRELALTERAYKAYLDELDGREELIMRKAELEETLERHKDNYDTILLTKKYINLAKDNMSTRYLGKTKAGFIKYAELIGGITGESFEMDTDFGVKKREGASTKGVEAYSRGTRDLFNLAARLALIDSLYEKERPFIILDDPFTAFDDGKTESALKLLRGLSKERQIIYFTCSRSRSI